MGGDSAERTTNLYTEPVVFKKLSLTQIFSLKLHNDLLLSSLILQREKLRLGKFKVTPLVNGVKVKS